MQIIDLTSAYVEHVLEKRDIRGYIELYPSLFKHYFRYWADRNLFRAKLSKQAIQKKKSLILSRLQKIEKTFHSAKLDLSKITIALFVGQGTTNGHALLENNRAVVWLPIEAYSTTPQVDVFVTHEIMHALHYLRVPNFYFHTIKQFRSVSRNLITEGIATYGSKELLRVSDPSVLWADYVSKQFQTKWLRQCAARKRDLFAYVQKYFHSSNPSSTQIFKANNPNDIFSYRAGYFIGLMLCEILVKDHKYSLKRLLSLSRNKLEKVIYDMIVSELESMS